jgi:hypothetical protein
MKLVSAFAGVVLAGFVFAGGANAAPLAGSDAMAGMSAASELATPVACRVVQKRVCVKGRGCRSSTSRICTPPRRMCRVVKTRTCFGRGNRNCKVVTRRVCR